MDLGSNVLRIRSTHTRMARVNRLQAFVLGLFTPSRMLMLREAYFSLTPRLSSHPPRI